MHTKYPFEINKVYDPRETFECIVSKYAINVEVTEFENFDTMYLIDINIYSLLINK